MVDSAPAYSTVIPARAYVPIIVPSTATRIYEAALFSIIRGSQSTQKQDSGDTGADYEDILELGTAIMPIESRFHGPATVSIDTFGASG